MRWQEEASRFDALNIDEVLDFAAPDIKEEAVARYNRAIGQIKSGSGDIASIALRQLASTYPDFAEAVLLNACCQMAWGEPKLALEALESLSEMEFLTEDERFRTDLYLKAVKADMAEAAAMKERSSTGMTYAAGRLARSMDTQARRNTFHGDLRSDDQYIQQLSEGGDAAKILIPASGRRRKPLWQILALVVGVLAVIFVAVRFLPKNNTPPASSSSEETSAGELPTTTTLANSPTPEPTPEPTPTEAPTPTPIIPPGNAGPDSDDSERLAWLLTALQELSPEDEAYKLLLDQYMALFEPTPTPTPTLAPTTTTAQPTTTAPPATTTTQAPTTAPSTSQTSQTTPTSSPTSESTTTEAPTTTSTTAPTTSTTTATPSTTSSGTNASAPSPTAAPTVTP